MTRRPGLRLLARSLAMAVSMLLLLVAACGPKASEKPDDRAPAALTPSVVKALTSSGVRITDRNGTTRHEAAAPASGLVLTTAQIGVLQAQAEAQSGALGAELDRLGTPAPAIPTSALLAAYARGVKTPGATLAAKLLGKQDLTRPQEVVFPALILTLFASDAAHAMLPAAEGADPAGGPQGGPRAGIALAAYHVPAAPPGGPCSDLTKAVYGGINKIFDALHIGTVNVPKTGLSFLDGLLQGLADVAVAGLNFAIEAGRTLVINAVRYTLDKVLAIVAKVASLAAMIGNFTSLLSPIHVKVEADPESTRKGVEPNGIPVTAAVTASLEIQGLGDFEWPTAFADCARVAGVDLPPLKPLGDPVEWTIHPEGTELIHETGAAGSKGTTLEEGGPGKVVANLGLLTGTEPADATGEQVSEVATVRAKVERKKVAQLRDVMVELGVGMLTSNLPPIIKGFLHDALVGAAKDATDGLVSLLSTSGWTAVEVSYHQPAKPKEAPKRREVWQGSWTNISYGSSGTFRLDVSRTGDSMAGALTVAGAECISAGKLQAAVRGSAVEFGLVAGGVEVINFTGTIDQSRMSGTWTTGAGCGNHHGAFEATVVR